ncbi:putative glucan endo-1,3-beta-glucosidase A6 [Drosera capensis]
MGEVGGLLLVGGHMAVRFFCPLCFGFCFWPLPGISQGGHIQVGVNYGILGNNLPQPSKSVELIRSLKAQQVKLYSPDPDILKALNGTKLRTSIMVPNQLISNISSSQELANEWIRTNFVPYYPDTLITCVLVGNEILTPTDDAGKKIWYDLVPAMRKIKYALKVNNITKVKVGTPLAMDVLESSFPPSNGTFRSDIASPVVRPLLQFLHKTKSFFFIDCYPYFAWAGNYQSIDLNYTLFVGSATYTDPVTGLTYTNLLDQMLDSLVFAMKRLGFPDIRIFISETGWPNGGDVDEIGANVYNAATYNRNLVAKLTANPVKGTPARPGVMLPTFIFSLFNENQKPGPGTERHWGLFYPNGSDVYPVHLSGKTPLPSYPALPLPDNNKPHIGKVWCVVATGANVTDLGPAVTYACNQGNHTCKAIKPGGKCYEPNTTTSHASYAFSLYWAQFRGIGGTCNFNGLAEETTKDPSYGFCRYPAVTFT